MEKTKEYTVAVEARAVVLISVEAGSEEEARELGLERISNDYDINWNDEVSFSVESVEDPGGNVTLY